MIILRIVGGLLGGLLTIGSVFAQIDLSLSERAGIGLFGSVVFAIAVCAKDKTIERWFGGF